MVIAPPIRFAVVNFSENRGNHVKVSTSLGLLLAHLGFLSRPVDLLLQERYTTCSSLLPPKTTVYFGACIHKRTSIDKYKLTYIHTYMHTYILTYIQAYIHTYIHTSLHTYIHTYKLTYIHTYIHTYKLTYIHTYKLTHIHTSLHTYRAAKRFCGARDKISIWGPWWRHICKPPSPFWGSNALKRCFPAFWGQ